MKKITLVISAFPGVGKTHLSRFTDSLDSDSCNFSWLPDTKIRNNKFPFNYIEHIKNNIGKYDFIFVSSHKEVRTCMIQYGIDFLSAYPEKSLKHEYLRRYKDRGNDEVFIQMMTDNWDSFIDSMEELQVMQPLILKEGQYLSDHFILNSDRYNSIEEDGGYYYDLFKFFSDQYGLTLVDTEIQDIIRVVENFNNHPIRKIINEK
jgi:hypothetical protein